MKHKSIVLTSIVLTVFYATLADVSCDNTQTFSPFDASELVKAGSFGRWGAASEKYSILLWSIVPPVGTNSLLVRRIDIDASSDEDLYLPTTSNVVIADTATYANNIDVVSFPQTQESWSQLVLHRDGTTGVYEFVTPGTSLTASLLNPLANTVAMEMGSRDGLSNDLIYGRTSDFRVDWLGADNTAPRFSPGTNAATVNVVAGSPSADIEDVTSSGDLVAWSQNDLAVFVKKGADLRVDVSGALNGFITPSSLFWLEFGNYDNDGFPDLFYSIGRDLFVLPGQEASPYLVNDRILLASAVSESAVICDMDNDGDDDVATQYRSGGGGRVFSNDVVDGARVFNLVQNVTNTLDLLDCADFNRDDAADLLWLDQTGDALIVNRCDPIPPTTGDDGPDEEGSFNVGAFVWGALIALFVVLLVLLVMNRTHSDSSADEKRVLASGATVA